MSLNRHTVPQIHALVASLREDVLSETEAARLASLLSPDADARRLYLELVALQVGLHWRFNVTNLAAASADGGKAEMHGGTVSAAATTRPHKIWFSSRLVAITVSLLLVGYFITLAILLSWDRLHDGAHQHVAASLHATQPAVLTRADDAEWKEPSRSLSGVANRVLQVRSGVAELEFAQGARVSVEGPAEFEVRSDNSGFLRNGKLFATVPPQALGFIVQTATAVVVDLGTEFGVEAHGKGATEVQVFKGKVELRTGGKPGNSESPEQAITLNAGDARRVEPAGKNNSVVVRDIAATPDRFSRPSSPTQSRQIPVQGVVASSTYGGGGDLDVYQLVRGHGLQGNRHSANWVRTMWSTNFETQVQNQFLLFDLFRPYRLDSMRVWNWNDAKGWGGDSYAWMGVKQADIYVSTSGRGNPLSDPTAWKLVGADQQFAPGTGRDDYDTPTVVALKNVEARFVAIVIDESLGQNPEGPEAKHDYVGLSEVQFFGSRVSPVNPATKK